MKICKSIASLLLCIAAVLRFLPVQVLAAGNIDLSRKGNLTITDSYDETGLSGVIFHIYRISAVDEYGKLTSTTDFRKYADQHPKELEKLARKLDRQQTFFLRGDEYARPKGHTDDALSGWYNRRSFSIACEREYDELSYSRDLLDAVKAGYEFLIPYYEYFDKSYRMAD
mgnify:CR=1 FL=1